MSTFIACNVSNYFLYQPQWKYLYQRKNEMRYQRKDQSQANNMRVGMKQKFNMIEIAVSLMLILVVMLSVVNLFNLGLSDNMDAVNHSYANDSIDQFLHQMAVRLEHDWDQTDALPFEKPSSETDTTWSASSLITNANYDLSFSAEDELDQWDPSTHNSGIFKIAQITNSLGADFTAEILAWKSETVFGTGDNQSVSLTLYAEISWPIHMAYEDRQKVKLQTMIYKPGLLASAQSTTSDMPCKILWSMNDSGTNLYFYILADGYTFTNDEGELDRTVDVSAFTLVNESIFFIDNTSGSALYSISLSSLDLDPSTPIVTTLIGSTGLSGSADEISGLQYVSGTLYGVTRSSKKIYSINTSSGVATFVTNLDVSGSFAVGGLTIGDNGVVYIVNSKSNHSQIYKFESFPSGKLILNVNIEGSKNVETLSAHPSGSLYAADNSKWYRINPNSGSIAIEVNLSSTNLKFDFDYSFESVNCPDEDELSCDNGYGETGIVDGVLAIYGGDGDDSIQVSDDGDYWKVKIDMSNGDTIEEWHLKSEITGIFMCGGNGSNQMQLGSYDGNAFITGGDGDDQIQGGIGNDTIFGGAGDDTIQGNEGDDILWGEEGNDNLQGGNGNDTLDGVPE
ncbi:MAG: hypothetical protein HRT89_08995 [Lentisphaeria bacterium]|nr:hypothetical protein [Lentisphaeria bacterium]